jgi:hypothetical protein
MSVPSAELTAPAVRSTGRAPTSVLTERLAGGRFYLVLVAVALIIGGLSLLIPSTPSYDPWAWLVWGREIVHINLQTTGGPSWKPLPMIFTVPLALFGGAAPDLWLVVARAGAVMAVVMVFKLCVRITSQLAGPLAPSAGRVEAAAAWAPPLLAGVIAAVGLALSGGFISDNALGYSEGLMTAIVLIAVERHLDGAPRQAFAVGFLAALDRPEIWLFWGPYGLWLFWKDPGARKLVILLFALIPVLWFLPEYWGSGHFLRGVTRAQHPRSNSPAFAECPFCTELKDHAWPTVLLRIKAVAAVAVVVAAGLLWRANRARSRWRLASDRERAMAAIVASGALGAAWWIVIGVMTQIGFSGNNRYLVLGAALIEIAGGVGWGWAALELGRAVPRVIAGARGAGARTVAGLASVGLVTLVFLMLPNWVGGNLIDIQRTHRALMYQAHLREDMTTAVNRLGGPSKIRACGSVMTEGFQVPMLAWNLNVHTRAVQASPVLEPGQAPPLPPNVIFQTRAQRNAHLLPLLSTWPDVSYHQVTHDRTFRVWENCRVT